jgi:RNA polymerase sigma factor (sigma-70 family)
MIPIPDYVMLWEKFKDKDRYSTNKIFEYLTPSLIKWTKRKYKLRLEDAEDEVLDAWYKAIKNVEKINSLEHLNRYLYLCISHSVIDKYRIIKKGGGRCVLVEDESLVKLSSEEDESEFVISIKKEIEWRIEIASGCLNKLEGKGKDIFLLYYVYGLDTGKIANLFNISSQTALNHKTRIKDSIKNMLLESK